ncbi:autoinducer binding domain-containing protein [Chitiniphilus eburneus]|uniref:LuxR family transcriptional regulator n=1 Tax=Chitiniphilus eburneus TaxID=2571148 RepID=A0A4U0PHU1_9NEIS|nr:autoinducer binding domain-containing protein [Chitiniphilus eburneus]TJZ67445.1 LuxR family transcriptional regulator [Chitiniphilus eburneus]
MKTWQADLLDLAERAGCEQAVFARVEQAARELGFEYCAYGLQLPYPMSSPRIVWLNNYPPSWRDHYLAQDYMALDPSIHHGRRSQRPLLWDDALFAGTPRLWSEARAAGLRVGWAQSSLDARGVGGMLTVARSGEPLGEHELAAQEHKLKWLASLTHLTLSRIVGDRLRNETTEALTAREQEVLKWTADGKSAAEISDILSLSKTTIDFHIRNAIVKLQTANKTAAVVRAALLGMLI